MRPITAAATVFATALVFAGTAAADVIPETGYLVFKETRGPSVTEVHAKGTGNLVYSGMSMKKHGRKSNAPECNDGAFLLAGTQWERDPKYYVNAWSSPRYLNDWKAFWDVVTAGDAWDSPFRTDCRTPKGRNKFEIRSGGLTNRHATLVTELESDGKNVVSFEDLTDTWCDGAVACTIIDYDEDGIIEADIAFETDLKRITGFDDFWTTSDRTWFGETSGRLAVSDVATHEFGHFAGLDHAVDSPTLTMYPWMHDGDDTLGLGDMLGMLELY
jgi:hypothetical protein